MAQYFPYDVKLRLLADSRSFLANQKARNAIVGAENLLIRNSHIHVCTVYSVFFFLPFPARGACTMIFSVNRDATESSDEREMLISDGKKEYKYAEFHCTEYSL